MHLLKTPNSADYSIRNGCFCLYLLKKKFWYNQFVMKKPAFTLIELLIVIAIIAALSAILLPALSACRRQVKAVICSSNLRQLSLVFKVYEQEKGSFPHGFVDWFVDFSQPPGGYAGDAAYDRRGWWWFQIMDIETKNAGRKNTVYCPSKCLQDSAMMENILLGNYGVNRSICKDAPQITGITGSDFVGKPLSLDGIARPSQTLLLVDSGYSIISWRGVSNISGPYFDNTRRDGAFYVPGLTINKKRELEGTITSQCKEDAVKGRHPKQTVNVIFTDGHLNRLKADSLFVEESGEKYHNQSPLWVPGN